jgi:hypothetical protein
MSAPSKTSCIIIVLLLAGVSFVSSDYNAKPGQSDTKVGAREWQQGAKIAGQAARLAAGIAASAAKVGARVGKEGAKIASQTARQAAKSAASAAKVGAREWKQGAKIASQAARQAAESAASAAKEVRARVKEHGPKIASQASESAAFAAKVGARVGQDSVGAVQGRSAQALMWMQAVTRTAASAALEWANRDDPMWKREGQRRDDGVDAEGAVVEMEERVDTAVDVLVVDVEDVRDVVEEWVEVVEEVRDDVVELVEGMGEVREDVDELRREVEALRKAYTSRSPGDMCSS